MQQIRKGSVISESQYEMTIVSKIVSDITVNSTTWEFQAKIISINDVAQQDGAVIDYLIGGTYGAHVEVLQY